MSFWSEQKEYSSRFKQLSVKQRFKFNELFLLNYRIMAAIAIGWIVLCYCAVFIASSVGKPAYTKSLFILLGFGWILLIMKIPNLILPSSDINKYFAQVESANAQNK